MTTGKPDFSLQDAVFYPNLMTKTHPGSANKLLSTVGLIIF